MLTRRQHGAVNEHKGPADFNAGANDDEDDEDVDASPPRLPEGVEPQMRPPQFQPPFSQILRHHTPLASPPVANGVPYPHPAHNARGATPQPPMGSRPSSRNDARRLGPAMVAQPVGGPQGPHPGITYMPTPPIYNPPASQPAIVPQHSGQYSYPPSHQTYVEERRPSAPPSYPTQHPPPPPPPPPPAPLSHAAPAVAHPQPAPSQTDAQHLPSHPVPFASPPPPQLGPDRRSQDPQPPPPAEPKAESVERPQPPLLIIDTAVKKMPQRKSHSIFTPIEENRSILSQHLASFAAEPQAINSETATAALPHSRSQSVDAPVLASRDATATSPELKRSSTQDSLDRVRKPSLSSAPDTAFTPPSRDSSLKAGGSPAGGARPRGPRLTVQIPDGVSEPGSATGESNSPPNPSVTPTQPPQRHNSHSSVVLPPPPPSASALLSAGASGPPNPFARPPPQQNVNGETPASALPSRFLGNELLPSPSSFYPEWNFRGGDNHMLPSPLNFTTPVVGSGSSFLREDNQVPGPNPGATSSIMATGTATPNGSSALKRKSPDYGAGDKHGASVEPKRVKVEYA